ncbi:sensor histidine kinase [Pedobacter nanyangensis]|uniref:sensor histidine kinase n=1 Tax=Pedobacter nanyangensis TaxID=1562389 RepID=UPI001F067C1C|nr:HAMP domain-containing sensor histidine kinase [Pedobacter nanyangensis]
MNTGLKIRLLMLLLGFCCFITAISLRNSITRQDLLHHEANELQENLLERERIVYDYLTLPLKLEELKKLTVDEGLANNFIATYRLSGINVFVYKNQQLEYWSTYKALPSNIQKVKEGASFVLLSNGYYELIKKTVGQYVFVFMITVKAHYAIENQYLKNEIWPGLYDKKTLEIASFTDKETTEIFSLNKDYLFTVKLSNNYTDNIYTSSELWLWIIGVIFVSLFINSCGLALARSGKLLWGTFLIVVYFIALRLTDLKFFWFNHQFDLKIFDPSIYAESDFLPSLGDLLLNVLALTCIWVFIYAHRKEYRLPKWLARNKFANYFLLTLLLGALGGIGFLTEDLFFGVVYYSKIDFNISNIINLGWISWLSIFILCLVWLNIYLMVSAVVALCGHFVISTRQKLYTFLVLLLGYTIYMLVTDYTVFYMIYALLIFMIAYHQYIQKNRLSVSVMAVIFLCMATITSIKYIKFEDIKERTTRTGIARKLMNEDDPKVMNAIELLEHGLTIDSQVVSYFKQPLLIQTSNFHNYISKNYLDGYLSRFEYKIFEYNSNDQSLKSAESLPINKYKNLVKFGAVKTQQANYFYRVNDTFGFQNYFGIIPVFDGDSFLGTMVVELTSRPYDYSSFFPDLLIDGKLKSDEDLSNYSLAFYKQNQLFGQSGKYVYPMFNSVFKGERDNIEFVNEYTNAGSYSHAVYKPANNRLIVISIEKVNFTVRLATLSFFFLIFIFFGVLIYIITWLAVNISDSRGGLFNLNRYLMINANKILYKTRIQFSIVLSVVATLIIVGWTTFFNIRHQYLEQQTEQVREKLRKVQLAYEKHIALPGTISNNSESQFEFNQFADVNGVYLNLFDIEGNLYLTSLPKLYDLGIISRKMGPTAYMQLAVQQKSEFINPAEKIGDFTYAAAYAPIRNANNQTVGYLSVPYYSNEEDYQAKIGLFINTLINIYALVFVLIGVLAVFLANQITSPLTFIQENIRRTKLGQTNQPIVWHRQDEIGVLIKEYNKMIAELEISANKLARSERESAWREMAKQVAHEIKNPLTPLKLGVQLLEKSWKENDPNFEKKFASFNKSFVEQIDSLATIASEFSNFAKMPDTKLEDIALVPIIEQAKEVFSSVDHVEIHVLNRSNKEIQVLGDKDQLLRSFNNLFKNAIEAADGKEKCVIKVHIANDEKQAFVEVEDNGKGIDPSLHSSIFRANFTTKSSGTGLGLAFVKQAIENAGGKVEFTSVLNNGTIFYLTFPLV